MLAVGFRKFLLLFFTTSFNAHAKTLPMSTAWLNTQFSTRLITAFAMTQVIAAMLTPSLPPLQDYLHFFCHQIPSRTFSIQGTYMGLCARCLGMYSGIVIAWVLFISRNQFRRFFRSTYVFAALVALVSIVCWLVGLNVDNFTRFLFGISLGIVILGIPHVFLKT